MQKSLYDDVCDGTVVSYPALIDDAARGRNFDDAGDQPWLYYTAISMKKCHSGNRQLVRERVSLTLPRKGHTR
jgi:hypothetical protein